MIWPFFMRHKFKNNTKLVEIQYSNMFQKHMKRLLTINYCNYFWNSNARGDIIKTMTEQQLLPDRNKSRQYLGVRFTNTNRGNFRFENFPGR